MKVWWISILSMVCSMNIAANSIIYGVSGVEYVLFDNTYSTYNAERWVGLTRTITYQINRKRDVIKRTILVPQSVCDDAYGKIYVFDPASISSDAYPFEYNIDGSSVLDAIVRVVCYRY